MPVKKTIFIWLLFLVAFLALIPAVRDLRLENLLFRLAAGDSRMDADTTQTPWRHVVKIQTRNSRCTGTILSPTLILTAAHCITHEKNGKLRMMQMTDIIIMAEYNNNAPEKIATVKKMMIDPLYLKENTNRLHHDWALIISGQDINLHPHFPLIAQHMITPPYTVLQAGYSQNSADKLQKDEKCRIVEHLKEGASVLLRHNCLISPGDSGGPLFIQDKGGDWRIIGVNIALLSSRQKLVGYALSTQKLAPIIQKYL